jgi:hypothetical protein
MASKGERALYGVIVILGIIGWLASIVVTSTLIIWAFPNWFGRLLSIATGVATGVWAARILWPYMEEW